MRLRIDAIARAVAFPCGVTPCGVGVLGCGAVCAQSAEKLTRRFSVRASPGINPFAGGCVFDAACELTFGWAEAGGPYARIPRVARRRSALLAAARVTVYSTAHVLCPREVLLGSRIFVFRLFVRVFPHVSACFCMFLRDDLLGLSRFSEILQ